MSTELREEMESAIRQYMDGLTITMNDEGDVFKVDNAQFSGKLTDVLLKQLTKREQEAYERGQDDELKSGKTFYFNHGVEAMQEGLKKHFGISNPKIEGVSWTINEMVDAVAKKLKGEI